MREPVLLFICGLLSLLHLPEAHGSPVTCSSPGMACEYNNNNYIDTETQVHSKEECRNICLNTPDCLYITFFNDSARPIPSSCVTLKSCDSVIPCDNCVSEFLDCFPCGFNLIGSFDENIVDVIFGIEVEVECKELCIDSKECDWYTFFERNDTHNHDKCFLLTNLLPPLEMSNTAISGPSDCSQGSCSLVTNGESHQSLMITDTGAEVSIIVRGSDSCQLTLLAVGGGGGGGNGGGGSGYLEYQTVPLDLGVNTITARVGAGGQPSILSINVVTNVTAESGRDWYSSNGHSHGGRGYSGGGGYGTYDGGSDGGNGEGYYGGYGSGNAISEFSFTTWTLSAGAGGKFYSGHSTSGGGGGGVMVGGQGPDASQYQGQGYGGQATVMVVVMGFRELSFLKLK